MPPHDFSCEDADRRPYERSRPRATRAGLLALLLVPPFLVGCGAGIRVPGPHFGGSASALDRSQIVIPAVSNPGGGVIWAYVNLWSGNLILVYPVLSVPAIGPDWEFNLYYNANLAGETTSLGPGWRHSYEIALLIGVPDPNSITVRWGDGRRDVFVDDGSGWASAPALHAMRITAAGGGYELRTKHGFVYAFDGQGWLTALRDRNGNAMALAYDAGRLTSMTDASGRTLQLGYDAQGHLASIAGLQQPSFATLEYDGGLLVRLRDPAGNLTQVTYNAAQLAATLDLNGDAWLDFNYHPSLPVVVRTVLSDGDERLFAYEPNTRTTSVTDVIAAGEESVTRYAFDAGGLCLSVTDGPLGATQNAYDGANNLTSHTDADGHTTAKVYSPEGDLLSVTDPTAATVAYAYDATFHLVLSVTDAAGNTWSGQRDGNGNLTTWSDPLGNTGSWAYNPQGLVTSHTDRRGNTTGFAYDGDGNLAAVTDPAGFTASATYNPRGIPLSITDQEGNTATITLTARDEPESVTLPGGSTYTLAWTGSRMLASVTDPRGAVVAWQYNDRKQVVARTDPLGFATTLEYNGAGFLLRAVNARGFDNAYTRDLAGRLTSVRDADGGLTSYALGCCDVLSRTDALGTLDYQYDPRHDLTAVLAADGTVQKSYARDSRRLLTAASLTSPPDPPLAYEFGHDNAGRRTSTNATHLGRTATFVLDPQGNVIQVLSSLQPNPFMSTFQGQNLPASVTAGSPPFTATMSYTPRRQVSHIAYSNGVQAAYNYDPQGRLRTANSQAPGFSGQSMVDYDASGNPIHILNAPPPPLQIADMFVDYDLRGMPTRVQVLPNVTDITYDPMGNRLHMNGPGGSIPYVHSPADRMLSAGPTTFQWNPVGGCTQVAGQGNLTDFTYRTDGALKSITHNGQTWQVAVGPLGEIARVVLPSGSARWYALDDAGTGLLRREIMLAPGAQPRESFVFVPGLEARAAAPAPVGTSAAPVMWLRGTGPASPRATLTDGFGSVWLIASDTGSLLTGRVYGLFGELAGAPFGPVFAQGFLGMEVEEGLSAPYLLGLSAGAGGFSSVSRYLAKTDDSPIHGLGSNVLVGALIAPGLSPVSPYLAETGSFLQDAGFGPDGLFGAGDSPPNRPVEALPWWWEAAPPPLPDYGRSGRILRDPSWYPWDFVGPLPERAHYGDPWERDIYIPPERGWGVKPFCGVGVEAVLIAGGVCWLSGLRHQWRHRRRTSRP